MRADRTRAARIAVGALFPSYAALVPAPAAHGALAGSGPSPRDGATGSKGRVCLIDHARGLFLFWMVVAHALGLAGVRDTSPLAFLIPPASAWLSERFVVLSGFTVAWVFAALTLSPSRLTRKLWRRAAQVGGVAYASNIVSAVAVDAMSGHLSATSVLAPAVLARPWSISWVLLPTTALLLLAPGVLLLARRVGAQRLFVLATVLGLVMHGPGSAVLKAASIGTLPIVAHLNLGALVGIVVLGIWGLTLALVVRRHSIAAFAAAYAGLSVGVMALGSVLEVPHFVSIVSRFGAFLGVATVLFATPGLRVTRAPLELLGRNALIVFVAHRFLEQAENALLGRLLPPEPAGAFVAATAVAAMLWLCRYKETHPALAARLKTIGF